MPAIPGQPGRPAAAPLLALALEPDSGEPLHRQLYGQLRELLLAGRLAAGSRLPASRVLAEELGCSRNTVVAAFDQLFSEGYLQGRVGAGTFVSRELPEGLLTTERPAPLPRRRVEPAPPRLSERARRLASVDLAPGAAGREALEEATGQEARAGALDNWRAASGNRAFALARPDTSSFPFDVWGRLLGRIWRRPDPSLLHSGPIGGLPVLRGAIASHLRTVRGLDCQPEQVLITAGGQQALDLAARVLLDPGDPVWIEDPGYAGLRAVLAAAAARAVPVPVDSEGFDLAEGLRRAPDARLAAVAPSHQYPLGIVMSLSRRLALLDWARESDAWILEDDYDSEYRYAGRPLAALQALEAARDAELEGAASRRVIYVGTFSKVMFPSLRLGYLVVPEALLESFLCARRALDDHPSAIAQPALAAFMAEGHFAAHIRRMRRLYAMRQAALLAAAGRNLGGLLELAPDEAGMHLVGRLSPELAARMDDREATRRAAQAGVVVRPLSAFHAAGEAPGPAGQGLLLGYASVPEDEIARAVARLAGALGSP